MGEWKKYRLADVVSLVIDHRGKTPKKLGGDWAETGYRALSAKSVKTRQIVNEDAIRCVDEEMYRRWMKDEIHRGDILVTSEAPYGEVYYWNSDEKIVLSQRLFGLRVKPEFDSAFIAHFMTSQAFKSEMNGRETGTTVFGLRQPELLDCKLLVPDLPTQRRIAAVLGALDDKIEVNRKICENLEAQAQALFKAWFVDFEPFGGKRPDEWKEVSLLDVVDLFDMRRIPLSSREREKRKGTFPYYGATSIMDYVDDYLFDGVYLLMGEDGSVAREDGIPYLQYISGQFWVNNHAHIMQGRNGYSTEMLWCALSQTDISTYVTGAVQPKLSQTNMQMIKVPILAMSEMRRFGESVQPMFDSIRTKRAESRALAAMRDALLPKLMSGELAVEKVEVK